MLEIRSQDCVHQVKRRLTLSSTTAAPALLEREAPLEALTMGLREAATGDGRIALVYGEAGIGKTSLLVATSPRALTVPRRPRRPALGRRGDARPGQEARRLASRHGLARQDGEAARPQ